MNKIQVSSSNIANYIIHTYVLIVLISWGSSSLFFLGSHFVLSSESFWAQIWLASDSYHLRNKPTIFELKKGLNEH